MGMLGGQGQQTQYGSGASMKGMPQQTTTGQGMKGSQTGQMGGQGYGQGYYSNQQPYSAGIINQYSNQNQGLYTGGPPQAQGYNGQGQGFNGQMGPQSPGSSQTNPSQQIGFGNQTPGSGYHTDPIARGGNFVFPASM